MAFAQLMLQTLNFLFKLVDVPKQLSRYLTIRGYGGRSPLVYSALFFHESIHASWVKRPLNNGWFLHLSLLGYLRGDQLAYINW